MCDLSSGNDSSGFSPLTWHWMIGKPRRCDLVWFGSYSHLSVQRENNFLRFRRQRFVVRPVFYDLLKERTSMILRNVGKYSPNDMVSDSRRLYCSWPVLWCLRPRNLSSAFVSVEWEYGICSSPSEGAEEDTWSFEGGSGSVREWRKVQEQQLCGLYCSLNVVTVTNTLKE